MPSWKGIGFLFAFSLPSSPAKKFAFHSSWILLFYLFSLL